MAAGGALSRHSSPGRDRAARLGGLTRIAADGTVAAADISEGVHRAIHKTLGMRTGPPGRTRGLTGFVYRWVRRVARLVGRGAATPTGVSPDASVGKTALALAVLNGVMGDRLEREGNPLATPLSFWIDGAPLAQATPGRLASPHIVLAVHGLCLDESCWQVERKGVVSDHSATLAAALGGVAVGVRYNSGRHISQNGADLAVALQGLVDSWPVPVASVTILAHSMGGLVTRSAVGAARERGLTWPDRVRGIVFLGTPHHGSPLERVGKWVHDHLRAGRFSAPVARAAELRSAGVTDLRWGAVSDADWRDRDRFEDTEDVRTPLPLPDDIPCYAVAAATVRRRGKVADELLGDGLVPLQSALGEHDDPARRLDFADARVMLGMGHVQLLSDAEVTAQILDWVGPEGGHRDADGA